MKRIYFYLFLLFCCLQSTSLQAKFLVKEIGQPITDLSTIKVGDQLLLYCNGPIDSSHKEFGTRNAFLREGNDHNLFISRDLRENSLKSSDFLWTVLSYSEVEGDDFSYKISLASSRGNYLPVFTENMEGKPRWPGKSVDPSEGEAALFTITITDKGDSLFYIIDENGVFFNGQSLPKGENSGQTRFVGWNSPGENSLYKVYIPTIEDCDSYLVTLVLNDENGEKDENSNVEIEALMGDTIYAPEWEHHTFVSATNEDDGSPVEFPYVVDGSEPFLTLMYETWPYVSLQCIDESTGEVIYQRQGYFKKGTKLALPSKEDVGIGFNLITEGYDDYEINKDEEIQLMYCRDGRNLPFEATTIENGQFAPNTKWYLVNIAGTKTLSLDEETMGITCGEVTDYSDVNLWAFVGDLEKGYQIYNKKTGVDRIMWAPDGLNKTQVLMTPLAEATSPNTFDLNFNGAGFSFKLHDSEMSYLNDHGGKGILKFWTNASSATGDGSRFTFFEYTEDLAHAIVYAKYITYLEAEDCVGGWTGSVLTELKQAYADRDTIACRLAVENLATADTIAFDAHKTYEVISAFRDFIAYQPKSIYAMAVESDSSLVWKSLEETDPAFHFGFNAASDSTYYIVSVKDGLPIGGFRFGEFAKCVEWGDLNVEENKVKPGHPAAFCFVKNVSVPASYYFVHNYGASIITLSANPNRDAKATSGEISTYNTKGGNFNNYWRIRPVGEWNAIENAVIDKLGQQKNVIYDLSGRRVKKAVRGLYIMNGKKIYVK